MKKVMFSLLAIGMLISQSNAQVSGAQIKVRFPVEQSGVYKITYEKLIDAGIQQPDKVLVYGNTGGMLKEFNQRPQQSMLKPIPVVMEKGSDEVFGQGDYILFYVEGPSKVTYSPDESIFRKETNPYSSLSYVYLAEADAASSETIQIQEPLNQTPTHEITTGVRIAHYEKELLNLAQTGTQWFGEKISGQNPEMSLSVYCEHAIPDSNAKVEIGYAVSDKIDGSVEVTVNESKFIWPYHKTISVYRKAIGYSQIISDKIINGKVDIELNLPDANEFSTCYLDAINVNYLSDLVYNDSAFAFHSFGDQNPENVLRYNIKQANNEVEVWDITRPLQPVELLTEIVDSHLSFKLQQDTLRGFIVFNPAKIPDLTSFESVTINDLSDIPYADMVIICHPKLTEAANSLASFHAETDGVSCKVVNVFDVYNNFSAGRVDPSAIYNFVKHQYQKKGLKYLLLFGSPSYDYRDLLGNNQCFVPNYINQESLRLTGSLSTDDYFGILTDSTMRGNMDIAIGRIPAKSLKQAQNYVEKIKTYNSAKSFGSWKNDICFIADDDDGQIHLKQADTISQFVNEKHPELNLSKIYLARYPQLYDSVLNSGEYQYFPGFPMAEKQIEESFTGGQMLINFTGHGRPGLMTHEQVFKVENYKDISNQENLPFLSAFTCEFSVIDKPELETNGSEMLFFDNGGVIGMLSSARLNFSGANHNLSTNFFSELTNHTLSLGQMLKQAKNNTGYSFNTHQFYLLCDPSLKLKWPEYQVITNRVNGHDVTEVLDTLKYGGLIDFEGYIANEEGILLSDFNGRVDIKLFNYSVVDSTITNEGYATEFFNSQGFLIAEQTVEVINGEFLVVFDFTQSKYNPEDFHGKVSYYAYNENKDAVGHFEQFVVKDFEMSSPEIEQPEQNIQVFPNPATTFARFNLPEVGNYQLLLTDVTGKVVRISKITDGNRITLQRQNLSKGIYFFKINNTEGAAFNGKILFN